MLCPSTSAVPIAVAIMTDSSRPSLPPPSDTDRSAASEHESAPTDASCPDPASATPTSIDAARENIPEPFREAVSALRKQTQTAAETIRALRAENQRLREKVEELSQRPDVRDNDAFAHFDDDRDALRERIQHFIDAIDDHLDSAPESGVASGKIEAAPLHAPTDPTRNTHAEAARDDAGAANDPPDTASLDNDSRDDILDAGSEVDEAKNEDIQNEDIQAEDTHHETDPLANGLPAAAQFEVEVPNEINGPTSKTSAASADNASESPGESTDLSDRTASEEPLLIAPGLSPRRSARRSTRRGRGR
jgi:regulator of replication initiation timing